MDSVTVSPRYQLLIPEGVRQEIHIRPGDRMAAIVKHGILCYVPLRPFDQTKGMTPGLNTQDLRDRRD